MNKAYLLTFLLSFASLGSYAQINISPSDTTVCAGTSLDLNATIGSNAGNFVTFTDDVYSGVINLGFSFNFYGNTYTQCVLSSNGFVSFDLSNATMGSPWNITTGIPGNTNCLNSIMGAYADIDPSVGGSIEYSTQGVAPNRRFVVTFCDVPMFNCNNLLTRFQIVLFETTNEIEFHIGDKPICSGWNSGATIQGVQNAAGTQAVVVPGRNFPGTWSATNSSHKFTPSAGTYTVTSIPFAFYPTGLNSITWYQNNNPTPIGTGPTITVTPTTNGYYIAQANGCIGTSVDTVFVNVVNNLQPPVVVSPVDVCQYDPSPALSVTGINLLWYTTPVGGVGTPNMPFVSTANAGTSTWYVSQSAGGCESNRTPLVINVAPTPPAPIAASVTYCQFEPAQPLAAVGNNLLWYDLPSGGIGTDVAPTPSTNIPGITTWYVAQKLNACESPRTPVVVTINQKPMAPTVMPPAPYCLGQSATPLVASGQNVNWYFGAPSGPGNPMTPVPSTSSAGTVDYFVTQTISGCVSDPAQLTVTVNPNPIINLEASKRIVCQTDTITVLNNAANDALTTYNWSFGNAQVISGTDAGPYQIHWPNTGNKTIGLTMTRLGCTTTGSISFIINPYVHPAFYLREHACINEEITLQPAWNSIISATYTWNLDGAEEISGSGSGFRRIRWTSAGTKYVTLTVISEGCDIPTAIDTITVHPTPDTRIVAALPANICIGDTIQVSASVTNSDNSYEWTPERFFDNRNGAVTESRILQPGNIYLQIADIYGCRGYDSLYVPAKACCEVGIPTAFTPNNDGRNDRFRIVTEGNQSIAAFRIVNRWGQTIFESLNQNEGWDGTFMSQAQPMGTYYYFLRYRCGDGSEYERKGEVTLIR